MTVITDKKFTEIETMIFELNSCGYDFTTIPKILKNYGYNISSKYVYQILNKENN